MTKRLLKLLGSAVSVVLLLALLAVLIVSVSPLLAARNPSRPAFFGNVAPIVVLGGSMEPTYHIGSILFIEKANPAGVQVGDIITFTTPQTGTQFEGTLTTHRVTSIDTESGGLAFHTQGDANNVEDTWIVPADTVVGRGSFSIPYLGYVSSFVRSKTGFIALVVIPAVLIVIMELSSIAKTLRERKKGISPESVPSRNAEERT